MDRRHARARCSSSPPSVLAQVKGSANQAAGRTGPVRTSTAEMMLLALQLANLLTVIAECQGLARGQRSHHRHGPPRSVRTAMEKEPASIDGVERGTNREPPDRPIGQELSTNRHPKPTPLAQYRWLLRADAMLRAAQLLLWLTVSSPHARAWSRQPLPIRLPRTFGARVGLTVRRTS